MSNWPKDIEAEFQDFRKNSETIKLVEEAIERSRRHHEWLNSLTEEERKAFEEEERKRLVEWILGDDSLEKICATEIGKPS